MEKSRLFPDAETGNEITKVEPATARTWAEKAYTGGVITDNAIFRTDARFDDTRNASAGALLVHLTVQLPCCCCHFKRR
jgi:hypothetical protein